ncbi:MAG TPA: ABC transporter ATP-binding protein [Bacteroidales bacterium]|nr:ABC transporter ATP-binding protein [Bacteroidales bacterium]
MTVAHHIATHYLSVGYGKHTVLCNISLRVEAPSFILLAGRNGSGKSTLLRTLLGLIECLDGDIQISGASINAMTALQRSKLIGYVSSKPFAINNFTVAQVVATGRAPYTNWTNGLNNNDKFLIEKAISDLKIENIADKKTDAISDGERQKTMIARALAQNTPIIILDEPTAFLDYPSKKDLINMLQRLVSEHNKIVISSSHDLDLLIPVVNNIWFCNKQQVYSNAPENMMQCDDFKMFYNK